ncbi:MAG: pyruvate kinase [Erysipelotrichaceae bacterium]|nr:pyruvate kinase [Erysipelotrichaceae bacterium]
MINKQTKIICTIGPASNNYDTILKMAKAGMDIARLNFSHGDHESHRKNIELIRKVEKENGLNIGILLDTKGPEIRLGDFANGKETYEKGETVTICKEKILGTHERFHIRCPELFSDVKAGDLLLVNDGKMQMRILENNGEELKCEILVSGELSDHKGCNVPGVKLSMPFISETDDSDIRFGCELDVDFIAASFTRRADDVLKIRRILREMGKPKISIIAKIENQEGYDNIDEILDFADGVMVARGDLGVEVNTDKVPIYQKNIIRKANECGKPVVTATQMLDSMTTNPRCTRAEAADVANAVLDGSDAVMLSGETAAGQYPVEAVETMAAIANTAEEAYPYREHLDHMKNYSKNSIQDAIGIAVSDASLSLPISAIVVFTQGGTTARVISKYRPICPIYAVTFTRATQHSLQDYWGVIPVLSQVQNEMTNDDELASAVCKKYGHKPGELIILSAGYPTGEGSANMMKIISIK